MKCRASALSALGENLARFGPSDGTPDWLVSAVWLCTPAANFLATASIEVLGDGYVARPLKIDTVGELVAELEQDLPDIEGRLIGRGCDFDLTLPEDAAAPGSLTDWRGGSSSMAVLVRAAEHAGQMHRVACGLLFSGEDGSQLLVGTDVSTLAMVYSQDPELIGRYQRTCEQLPIDAYLKETGA